ncbi:MAG: 50S ribosomal protein L21 [bacterium]
MQAVIVTGGKQFKVSEGDVIKIEKIEKKVGGKIDFEPILISDKETVSIDKSHLENAKVHGEVISQVKGKKVIAFKKKRRKGYSRKIGHRQLLTEVKIGKISLGKVEKKNA